MFTRGGTSEVGKGGVLKKRWGSAAQASRAHLSGLILRVPEAVHRGGGGGEYGPPLRMDGMTDAVDMNLGQLWEMVKARGAYYAAIHGVAKSRT